MFFASLGTQPSSPQQAFQQHQHHQHHQEGELQALLRASPTDATKRAVCTHRQCAERRWAGRDHAGREAPRGAGACSGMCPFSCHVPAACAAAAAA